MRHVLTLAFAVTLAVPAAGTRLEKPARGLLCLFAPAVGP